MLPRTSLLAAACALLVAGVISFMTATQLRHAWLLKDHLSDIADAYTEADVVRSAEAYAALGLTSNAGLPDTAYGTSFEDQGAKLDPQMCKDPARCVYLHSPQGVHLVTGVMMRLAGPHVMFVYRLPSLLFGLFAYVLFARAAWRTLGELATAALFAAFAFVPMSYNMMHGISYHGYEYHLFLVELALLFAMFVREGPPALGVRSGVALGVVAFVAGWFGYEFVALTALAPLPVVLLRADWRERRQLQAAAVCSIIAGGAFLFAQVVHLGEVAVFLGGLGNALRDLSARGRMRSSTGVSEAYTAVGLVSLYFYYWSELLDRPMFLGFSFLGALATFAAALRMRGPRPVPRWLTGGAALVWDPPARFTGALALAFAIPTLWITVMQAHAYVHGHFLPRLYMMTVIFAVLLVAKSVRRADAARGAG